MYMIYSSLCRWGGGNVQESLYNGKSVLGKEICGGITKEKHVHVHVYMLNLPN